MPEALGIVRQRLEDSIARIDALGDEAKRIFLSVDRERARSDADQVDRRLDDGQTLPLAGTICSIKDLINRRGERSTAGSRLLQQTPVATGDAEVVTRLEAAGTVILGRTNLSEFAYSGVGLNPHYGTPGCIFDPNKVPGGSSSGAALSVAHRVCDIAIGTDTGGSVRIPAAVNGLYGIKPTAHAVSTEGVHPLSTLMDSVGPLTRDWALARQTLAVLRGTGPAPSASPSPLRLGFPEGPMTRTLVPKVAQHYQTILDRIRRAGVDIVNVDLNWLDELPLANRSLIACEAHQQYGPQIELLESIGDPHVLDRIRFAESVDAQALASAQALRQQAIERFRDTLDSFGVDAILAPTLPIETPTITDAEANFTEINVALLRNTSLINFVDGCACSLPVLVGEPVPAALMVAAASAQDDRMLASVESLLPLLDNGNTAPSGL